MNVSLVSCKLLRKQCIPPKQTDATEPDGHQISFGWVNTARTYKSTTNNSFFPSSGWIF